MDKQKTELVVKSNRLMEASYRLNLVEQQMILFAICRSRENQKGFTPDTAVTIRAADFAAQFGSDINGIYSRLKEAVRTLYERSIKMHDIDPVSGRPRVTETRWISDKSYIDGTGQIQLTFAPKIIPFITRLGEDGGFTSYRLEKIGGMSSSHAVRLYELLIQYLSIGQREIELEWFRTTLAIEGQYKAIKDLKKYVIDLAVDQINKHSDIDVSYTQRKTGRTVTHLTFDITAKPILKKISAKPKKQTIDQDYVNLHARPGETYPQAYKRLLEAASQRRLPEVG
jgi:plasmid replication initiation protein